VRVIIGADSREPEATRVALKTLRETSGIEGEVLNVPKLRDQGLFTRVEDTRGRRYDFASQAYCSTEFANARFLVPLLGSGFVLFTDCDVVFQRNVRDLLVEVKTQHAVSVVKHRSAQQGYGFLKMDAQPQQEYSRKNWSSVMLFNCDHPANRRLSLRDVNERPGRDLHAFYWLNDHEIGALDPCWNWLVNAQDKPAGKGIAHFTLGGPFTPGWQGASHDEIWLEAAK
jgi:hypothetical protein